MTDTSELVPVKRCGRLDPHEPHRWEGRREWPESRFFGPSLMPKGTYRCKGFVLIEGGEHCTCHQGPIAACTTYAEYVAQQNAEWWA